MNTVDDNPAVSIGMPVYNEDKYLPEALESLLAQDFSDFELIISDNASTDATPQICMEFASRDPRIRCYRNDVNLGSVKNFNRTFELSRGEYFMWAAADDLWHLTLLSRCLETMRSDPSVVLVYPQAILIDDEGNCHGTMPGRLDTRDYDPISRFNLTMWGYIYGNHVYGLIRANALRKTRLFRNMFGSDMILLAELSLLGAFACIPEPLFSRRRIRKGEDTYQRHKRWLEDIDPSNRGKYIFFPGLRLFYEYITVATHAPFSLRKRLMLVMSVLIGFPSKYGKSWIKPLIIK